MANALLSTKSVGSIVKLNLSGTPTEFIVVHQGRPSGIYDTSCDGTWLLMKDIYNTKQWHSSNNNDYANSTIHSYLNTTFLNLFDAKIKSVIKQVKIPYRAGSGYSKTVTSGANGLSAKIFLLSSTEVSFNHSYMPTSEGSELSYFAGCADDSSDSKRIANLNGSATGWWLRSPFCNSGSGSANALYVNTYGNWISYGCSDSHGIRPALVLPSSLSVSDDGSVVTVNPPTISGNDGNIGTITSDYSYTATTENGAALTIEEKVNGTTVRTFTTTSGKTNKVNILDLTPGTGTIEIVASANGVSATRSVTYTKNAAQWPSSGEAVQMKDGAKNQWPTTLAELVRIPGGGDLASKLVEIAQKIGGNIAKTQVVSYIGTGTFGNGNPNSLTFDFAPKMVVVMTLDYGSTHDWGNALYNYGFVWIQGMTDVSTKYRSDSSSASAHIVYTSINGNTLSWYLKQTYSVSGDCQLNESGVKYIAIAIG